MSSHEHSQGESFIIHGDGVRLAAFENGIGNSPTVVFVHGYPDTHAVWDAVIARLADRFHCVAYDVRGAGDSQRPRPTAAYRLSCLAADLAAVIDKTSPNEPVHVVGHDWGSIQSWEAVTDPRLAERIASFTSISGPCLDHVGHWLREQWQNHPARLAIQARKSWYIAALHLPLLSDLAWYTALGALWPHLAKRYEGERLPVNATLRRDGAFGAKLYRANVLSCLRHPRERRTRVPVQIVRPEHDPFVGPGLAEGLERWVDAHEINTIDAAHWAVMTRPDAVAGLCRAFIEKQARDAVTHVSPSGPAPSHAAAHPQETS